MVVGEMGEEWGGRNSSGVWDGHTHTAIFKMDNQNRELCSELCGSLDGRGVWGKMDTCICKAESLCCSPETMTTLLISYVVVLKSPSHVWFFATPWTEACQASLSLTISWSLPEFISIALVMPSSHLILWCLLLLLALCLLYSLALITVHDHWEDQWMWKLLSHVQLFVTP